MAGAPVLSKGLGAGAQPLQQGGGFFIGILLYSALQAACHTVW